MATKEKSSVIYLITDKICDIMKDSHEMDKKVDKSLGEALAYMRNLPKIYIKELELNRSSFLHILGNLSHFFYDNKSDASASRYMSLEYDVVQGYCSSGFPIKYAYSNYSQYNRTINVALLFYYYAIRSEEHEFTKDEYERMFGTFFLDEKVLNDLKNNKELSSRCLADVEEKLRKKSLSGCWQERFEENWRKKRPQFLENQIVKGQIIRDNFMPVEEFDKLADQGATLKRAINFLDKLTTESHDRCSDNDVVLVPYKEYHALHELLLENPREKASLEEKHAKMVHRLERIFSRQVKKSN